MSAAAIVVSLPHMPSSPVRARRPERFVSRAVAIVRCLLVALALGVTTGTGWAHGDLDARIRELRAALLEHPHDAKLHFDLATALCEHEEWLAALEAAACADELAPGAQPTDLPRGRALAGLGRNAEAQVVLDRVMAAHPELADLRLDRARILAKLGNVEASLADYRVLLRDVARPNPEMIVEVANALATHGQPAEALAALETGTSRIGAFPVIELKALELSLVLERFDGALRHIEVLRRLSPRPESWMAERAEVLTRAGRIAEARAAWDDLLRHIEGLPNLRRGTRELRQLAEHARARRAGLSS